MTMPTPQALSVVNWLEPIGVNLGFRRSGGKDWLGET